MTRSFTCDTCQTTKPHPLRYELNITTSLSAFQKHFCTILCLHTWATTELQRT